MNQTAKQQLSRNPSNAGYATPLKTYSVPATENQDGTINVPAQPVYGIDPDHEPIDSFMKVRTVPGGTITTTAAATIMAFAASTVPAGFRRRIYTWVSDITCTATVGNRLFVVRVRDALGNIIWIGPLSAAVVAAQICGYDVVFGSGAATSTTVRRNIANTANTNVQVLCSSGLQELAAGYVVDVIDTAAVDANDVATFRTTCVDYPA